MCDIKFSYILIVINNVLVVKNLNILRVKIININYDKTFKALIMIIGLNKFS